MPREWADSEALTWKHKLYFTLVSLSFKHWCWPATTYISPLVAFSCRAIYKPSVSLFPFAMLYPPTKPPELVSELRDGEDRSRYAHTFRLPTSTEEIRAAVAEAFVAPISPLPPLWQNIYFQHVTARLVTTVKFISLIPEVFPFIAYRHFLISASGFWNIMSHLNTLAYQYHKVITGDESSFTCHYFPKKTRRSKRVNCLFC